MQTPADPAVLGQIEADLALRGVGFVIGVDEVGRGPLAGPVVACACLIPITFRLEHLNDSKQLSPTVRRHLATQLLAAAQHRTIAYAITANSHGTIDRINILAASLDAMARAITRVAANLPLASRPLTAVVVDGNRAPRLPRDLALTVETAVKGDARSIAIAAASVLAKETRDAFMTRMDTRFPGYGFATHAGYPTAAHRAALATLGPTPIHRRTFNGVLATECSPKKGAKTLS